MCCIRLWIWITKPQTSPEWRQNCELSDGQVGTISSERSQCSQVLSKPNFIGLKQDGIKSTFLSIMKFHVDNWKDLFNNNVCSGYTAMLEGIAARLRMKKKVNHQHKIQCQFMITSKKTWCMNQW